VTAANGDIGSNGSYAAFDEPRWASFGVSSTPLPIAERILTENEPIGRDQFEAVVRLAHKIPDFGAGEGSSRAVALYRVLRGCSTSESGFLDFAIALEAALLSGATTELVYRFSLYGSLFSATTETPPLPSRSSSRSTKCARSSSTGPESTRLPARLQRRSRRT
jgi:hypothetical protein